ncbi:MAG: disk-shape morphogenesis protein volactin, partial [Planctomycetota bacterium]
MCAKGVDTGEGFIIGADRRSGELVFTPERTTFLRIPAGDAAEKKIQSLGIYTLKLGNFRYILGEDALRISRALKRPQSLVFPFRAGVPDEEGRKVLATMISAVLGTPSEAGEPVVYTVHGTPVDGQVDFAGIGGFWGAQLANLGYQPQVISRSEAALLGAVPKGPAGGAVPFGVGIVFGEMAVDVCVRFRGGSTHFSLMRGSDWIDAAVARMKKVSFTEVRHVRESVLDLTKIDLSDPLQSPLEIYVEHQIHYTLQQLAAQMMKARLAPKSPLEIVAAGCCAE